MPAGAHEAEADPERHRRADDAAAGEKSANHLNMYLGLHVGEVFYGNIGSMDRLDFTVVGPAVNEVSRIAAMCRSVEQPSCSRPRSPRSGNTEAASCPSAAMRCVASAQAQELFTLDPARRFDGSRDRLGTVAGLFMAQILLCCLSTGQAKRPAGHVREA